MGIAHIVGPFTFVCFCENVSPTDSKQEKKLGRWFSACISYFSADSAAFALDRLKLDVIVLFCYQQ
jgi:hypothetical protein